MYVICMTVLLTPCAHQDDVTGSCCWTQDRTLPCAQEGLTALIWASLGDSPEVVQVLLAAGADRDASTPVGGQGVVGMHMRCC